jgi:hypothetical protein
MTDPRNRPRENGGPQLTDNERPHVPPTESRPPLADDAQPIPSPTDRRSPLTNVRRTRPAQPHRVPTLTPSRTDNRGRAGQSGRPRLPRLAIDRAAVRDRYAAVLSTSDHREFIKALVQSVTDVPALVSEVDRLWLALVANRRLYANLAAACRAAIAADEDGESDPLSYVRDELLHASLSSDDRGRR